MSISTIGGGGGWRGEGIYAFYVRYYHALILYLYFKEIRKIHTYLIPK